MKTYNDDKSISFLIKTTIVLFVSIMIYQKLSNKFLNESSVYDYYNLRIVALFVVSALLSNKVVLSVSSAITKVVKNNNISNLIEIAFLMLFIFFPMYLFHFYENEFKFIFVLIIILTVIRSGLKYGIISSIVIDTIILTADIFSGPNIDGINILFERDLVICIIFIFIAWIFGQYVTIESNNKIKKEKELKKLSIKLKEQFDKRKKIEFLLLKNEVCYDMVFENSPNSIILHDGNKILYANKSAAMLLGYDTPTGLSDKSIFGYYSEEKREFIKTKYVNIIKNNLSKIVTEESIFNGKGETIDVRNTSSSFTYNGEPCVLTCLFDITPEKQLETLKIDAENNLKLLNETKEFNNMIREFFTNMSHELKTPVNVIYSAVQTINMYLENYNSENRKKFESYLKIMKQNCLRMIRIINNFLDITRLDSGFIKINMKNDNIVDVVENITQSVAYYVNSKGIELIFDTNVEEKIVGFDHDMMERIMLNLIANALKYSHSNGHIYVNFEDREDNVLIKIKDEGDGIPEDKLNVIFERFGQANSSMSRKCEGTGIGLYLVRSFVEMHDGKISVTSVVGEGSEFTIELPTKIVQEDKYIDKVLFKAHVEKIEIEFSDIYSIHD